MNRSFASILRETAAIKEIVQRQQRMYEQFQRSSGAILLQQIIAEQQHVMSQFEACAKETALFAEAISRAMQPLPLPSEQFLRAHFDLQGKIEAISRAIASATWEGTVEFGQENDPIADEHGEIADHARSRIIEVVSADTARALDRIGFEPFPTLDAVLRQPDLLFDLDGRGFEEFVARLVDLLGFENVELTPRSSDNGRDVLATKHVEGIQILFAIECKRYGRHRKIGPETIRGLAGTILLPETEATMGLLVTTARFSSGAQRLILSNPRIDGKDFNGVIGWIREAHQRRNRA